MPLATTRDLLRAAQSGGYAVPAFNVIGVEHAEGIVQGAEDAWAPVILQLSENAVKYHLGAVEPIGRACGEIARAAKVPVSLHLDHATTIDLCARAVAVGFSSVMLDVSDLPYEENVARTTELVEWAHPQGVSVEAGLGIVGGKGGAVTTEAGLTDPDQARAFAEATRANALAVAVGSTHGMRERTARLDLDRVDRLRDAVDIPLVLHGSSGVPDADLAAAAARGIVKINLATQLNIAFTAVIRQHLAESPDVVDPRSYLTDARVAIRTLVADRLGLLGTAGKAVKE